MQLSIQKERNSIALKKVPFNNKINLRIGFIE